VRGVTCKEGGILDLLRESATMTTKETAKTLTYISLNCLVHLGRKRQHPDASDGGAATTYHAPQQTFTSS
jgi:hypothetical protein